MPHCKLVMLTGDIVHTQCEFRYGVWKENEKMTNLDAFSAVFEIDEDNSDIQS